MWVLFLLAVVSAQEYHCEFTSKNVTQVAGIYLRNCDCGFCRDPDSDQITCDIAPYNVACCSTMECGTRRRRRKTCLKTLEYCPELTLLVHIRDINITTNYIQQCDCADQDCNAEINYYANQTGLPCWIKDGQLSFEKPSASQIGLIITIVVWCIFGPLILCGLLQMCYTSCKCEERLKK